MGPIAGYADESEANFISWLACVRASPAAQYSGWLAYQHIAIGLPPAIGDARRPLSSPVRMLSAERERLVDQPAVAPRPVATTPTLERTGIEEGIATTKRSSAYARRVLDEQGNRTALRRDAGGSRFAGFAGSPRSLRSRR